MSNVFEDRVRWEFKLAMHGYGKTCEEALIDALETNLRDAEAYEMDFKAIEKYEVISFDKEDFLMENEDEEKNN